MALPRESMFLPTIKCSSCSREVEISMMGDHICEPPEPELSLPPEKYEAYTPYSPAPFSPGLYSPASPEKQGHIPPSLDVNAANHPFLQKGQLTPNSEPRSRSSINDMECFFDDVPTPHEDDLIMPSPRPIDRPGAYGGFGEKKHGPDFQPRSVSPNGGANSSLFKRVDTIAPGPFDPIRSPSANSFPREITESRDKSESFLSASPRDYFNNQRNERSPSPTGSANDNNYDVSAPPRRPTRDDYEGFGRPSEADELLQPQPLGIMNRSDTFPKLAVRSDAPLRTTSAPGVKHERTASSGFGHASKPSMGPDTSRAPPPRKSLLHPSKSSKYSASVDLAAEFGVNNPYHTPSDSTSSGFSTFSHQSNGSSQTSQTRSQPRRDPSDLSAMDGLMEDLESSMEALGSKNAQTDAPVRPARARSPLAESPLDLSRERPVSANRYEPQTEVPPQRHDSQPNPLYAPSPQDHYSNTSPLSTPSQTLPPALPPPVRKATQDPVRSRGNCKACSLAITGKSISSADGRLTGKYHKACFVCTTCSEPFKSAEFYVLNDKPYCEHHYHKLNGSLCGSCERGIEGQYLEDEFSIKYHVGCFRCLDCGRSLSDGYFEVEGKSYCERDAWRRVQQSYPPPAKPPSGRGPPGSRPPMMGLPGHPAQRMGPGMGLPRPPYGMPPPGNRLAPGPPGQQGPRPRMNKRHTRLGMM
ncbi:hypothetical protein SNK03_003285 [Fusarium graminearum]|uniref:Chromosome 1, complete genome n=2 Tax=Gibberella zeae TaxID=5518 RepID=I1RZT7_GIBZE|nr:hypothetical protein FGSG_09941 [Fusarium graminearum PH-1]KAI6749174.1 hypothetical protein HG531_008121 [Fusarium graminearum]ESU16586.1 hypothetical protein FGSG_09941 [Fusarium graminearum PH-1]PCD31559.1 hypothetical protein FGRA07_10102 [Fusarium graminearum]CAF3445878.1 unnamed protein product [Fusarium graminearum]CAF3568320.1 unnamed protein product [Fusarium graminearum]|eukprot:XP_011318848.1 hypothetical protein FGSG_09941 [Fusarium graminearum PH-1]